MVLKDFGFRFEVKVCIFCKLFSEVVLINWFEREIFLVLLFVWCVILLSKLLMVIEFFDELCWCCFRFVMMLICFKEIVFLSYVVIVDLDVVLLLMLWKGDNDWKGLVFIVVCGWRKYVWVMVRLCIVVLVSYWWVMF